MGDQAAFIYHKINIGGAYHLHWTESFLYRGIGYRQPTQTGGCYISNGRYAANWWLKSSIRYLLRTARFSWALI
ncbi:hypothetical protein PILCRDRAFT_473845 [Piloderma croceum F 1598]|uniref:Uncharacterized protein n=1 Tax=Piloderma croceum (strain F 1598) TaxID=765440 RepID=A0A0C3BY12_PILCF|nr:hypothetical protein PILCRDRAFT_473845 [Piloderma croceum F 1598]